MSERTGTGLAREIGLLDATMIVVSGVIGGGIFFTPATVAARLGDGTLILAVWIAGAIISYAGALTFAELASRYPEAGGHYIYIRTGFGRLWAFLYGWVLLLIIATGALSSLALAFAGYLSAYVPLSTVAQKIVAALLIVLLSIVNILGVKPGARTNTVLTTLKVAAFALLIGMGLFADRVAVGASAPPDYGQLGVVGAFGIALVPVLFSYGGWQQLNFMAGEVRGAERKVPAALALGVGVVAFVYIGLNMVYLRALGPDGMASSNALATDAGTALLGGYAGRAITTLIMVSILAFSNVVVMVTPRVFYAMAADGVFLRRLADVHPRFRTPVNAIVLQCIWAIVLVFVIGSIGALVNGVVFADWIFFGLGAASIFVIRRRADAPPGFYRVPGYPVVPAFFVLSAIVAVASAILGYPKESLLGTILLAAGAAVFMFMDRRSGDGQS